MKPERIIILANASSRTLNRQALAAGCDLIARHTPCEIVYTSSIDHARETAARISADPACLLAACGGDGTIHTIFNSIAPQAIMGIVPAGTANVIARELGIPTDIRNACKALLTGAVQQIDAGVCDDRKFLFVAGIGFDARVAGAVSPCLKKLFGRYAYHVAGVQQFFGYRPPRLTVKVAGSSTIYQGHFAMVANMRRYGGDLFFAHDARHDDGLLDLILVKNFNISTMLRLLNFARGNGRFPSEGVERLTGTGFVIQSSEPVPYQLDGEVFTPRSEFNFALATDKARLITP